MSKRNFLLSLFSVMAGLLVLAGTASASSGSIVFVKNHNVWLAKADGSGQYQVTVDGTYENPWRSPSQADDGTIAASHFDEIVRLRQNGQVLNTIDPPPLVNSVSHPVDGVPVEVAISPNGKLIAWSFVSYECPVGASCGARPVTGYTAADRLTDPDQHGSTFFTKPSWIGNARTLQSGGYGSQVNIHDLGGGYPEHWFDDSDYASEDTDLGDAELSPDGKRLAAIRGYGSGTHVIWYRVAGNALSGPAPAVPEAQCVTSELEGLSGPSWSPDSESLIWEEPDGIWLKTNMDTCDSPQPGLLIEGASEPEWGPAAVNPGPRNPGIRIKPPQKNLKLALKRGLKFKVKATGPGRIQARVLQNRTQVAIGTTRAKRAGWTVVTARFTAKARKKLARTRKVRLKAKIAADGKTGGISFTLRK
ncbi:MAG: hypothetical protein WBP55_01950 [Solirubrobacterales bacterium]